MLQAKGANARVIIQEEDDGFGKAPLAVDAQLINMITCGLALARPFVEDPTIRGGRNPAKPGRDVNNPSGALSLNLQPFMAPVLKGVFGSVATADNAGIYTHTFKVGASLPSFLVELGFPDVTKYFLYRGVKMGRLSFNVTAKGLVPSSVDLLGAKAEAPAGASYDDTAADLGYAGFDGYSIGTIEEGGAAAAAVVGIQNFTIANDLDGDQYDIGGGGNRSEIPEGKVKVSGTLQARFVDLTYYQKALDHAESSLRFAYAFGTGAGSAGNESLEFKAPELVYSPRSPAVTGPKGILADLAFEGYYDNSAEASALVAILKNTQAVV